MLDGGLSFAGEQDAGFAGGGAGESGVNAADAAIATEIDGSRIGAETDELRKLVRDFVDGAREQDRIRNGKLLDERGDAGLVFQRIARGFKTQTDNFQAAGVIFPVQIDEKRSFVAAVGAPGSSNSHKNDLALELIVGVGDRLSVEIGKLKLKRLAGISDAGETRRIRRFGNTFGARFGNASGQVFVEPVVGYVECAVRLERGFKKNGTLSGKVTEDKSIAATTAGERAGVSVNAQDGAGNFRTGLTEIEFPGKGGAQIFRGAGVLAIQEGLPTAGNLSVG